MNQLLRCVLPNKRGYSRPNQGERGLKVNKVLIYYQSTIIILVSLPCLIASETTKVIQASGFDRSDIMKKDILRDILPKF